MSSHLYEVALSGGFWPPDLGAVLHRAALHAEACAPFRARELVFEPLDAAAQRAAGTEPELLRARREVLEPGADWVLYSFLKPESERVHPEATVRPWAPVSAAGDAVALASALGYVRRAHASQIYKAGYAFRRGPLVILVSQQEQVDPRTEAPVPASASAPWEVEVKTAQPVRNTQETPLPVAIAAVLEVQRLLRGLLDLRRLDV